MRCTKWLSVVLAALAVGCLADAPREPTPVAGHRVEWIVDGTAERGENAVVVVYNTIGALCTGSLIAPRVVMTAKHCVQAPEATGPYSPSAFVIGIGASVRSLSRQYRVSDVWTTPGVWTNRRGLGGAVVGVDIGLLTLTEAVEGVV